jgi:DNA-binding NtrC family response regulator
MSAFRSYSWPGNVRELQNLVERAVIMADDGVLANPLAPSAPQAVASTTGSTKLKDLERAYIVQTLEEVGWVVGGAGGAAAKLGLKRTTLMHRMKKLQIEKPALSEERLKLPLTNHPNHRQDFEQAAKGVGT